MQNLAKTGPCSQSQQVAEQDASAPSPVVPAHFGLWHETRWCKPEVCMFRITWEGTPMQTVHCPGLSLSCVSHRWRCSEPQTQPIRFSHFWSQPKFLLFLTTMHQLCMLDVPNKNQSSIVTVFCFVFQFCFCKGQPVLVFISRVMFRIRYIKYPSSCFARDQTLF